MARETVKEEQICALMAAQALGFLLEGWCCQPPSLGSHFQFTKCSPGSLVSSQQARKAGRT